MFAAFKPNRHAALRRCSCSWLTKRPSRAKQALELAPARASCLNSRPYERTESVFHQLILNTFKLRHTHEHHVESIAHLPANHFVIIRFFVDSWPTSAVSIVSAAIGGGKIRFVSPRLTCSRYALCRSAMSCGDKHGRHSAHSSSSQDTAHFSLAHSSANTAIFLSDDIICSTALALRNRGIQIKRTDEIEDEHVAGE